MKTFSLYMEKALLEPVLKFSFLYTLALPSDVWMYSRNPF